MKKMNKKLATASCDLHDDPEIIENFGEPFSQRGKGYYVIRPNFFAWKLMSTEKLTFFSAEGPESWYHWWDGFWKPIYINEVSRQTYKLIMRYIRKYKVANYDSDIPKVIRIIIEIVKLECDRHARPALDPDVIPFHNCYLRWDRKVKKFTRHDYSADDNIFSCLDAVFDPEAKSQFFTDRLNEIIPDKDDQRVVQQYLGAALFMRNKTRKFLMLSGEGGCGKSVLVILLTAILTTDRVFDLKFEAIKDSYEFSSLTNQTSLFTASEVASKAFSQSTCSEFLKRIVGGDLLQTRRKFINEKLNRFGTFSLIVVTNDSIRFKYDGKGEEFRDRLIAIHFGNHMDNAKQIKDLPDILLSEHRSAIVNWLLEGALKVRLNKWNIALSKEQMARRDAIIAGSKCVEFFIKEHVKAAPASYITSQQAYEFFEKHLKANNLGHMKKSEFQELFADAMPTSESHSIANPKGKGSIRGYRGYKLV